MPARPEAAERALPVLAILVLPWLLLWPAPLVLGTHVLSAPDQEAVQHLWGLWAAWEAGDPIRVSTDRISWPTGFAFVLIDPGNLPFFALGGLLSPVAGYNLVLLGGVMVAGVAGALLARAVGAAPRQQAVGAVAAMASPALLSSAAEGITESFAVGWVGVAAGALLLHLRADRGWRWGALAALALAWAVWGGPYNAVWGALVCGAIGLWHLRARRRTVPVGLAAVLLSLPVAGAMLADRMEGLPGTASRVAWEMPHADPEAFRGGFKLGADLTDPFLPAFVTGGVAEAGHTTYLGVLVLALAAISVFRAPRRWPWLAGAAVFVLLALGPWLVVWGRPIAAGDGYVVAPVGGLATLFPDVLRLTRWYRAAAVAALLLAPLVATSSRRHLGLVAGAIVLDALVLAPMQWPVRHFDARPAPVWEALDRPGAVVDLPPVQWSFLPEDGVRDANLLQQTWHGRPTTATFFNLSGGAADAREVDALEAVAKGRRREVGDAPERLAGMGYAYVVADRTRLPEAEAHLAPVLGPPVAEDAQYVAFALPSDAPQVEPEFPPLWSPRPPPGGRPGGSGPLQTGPGGHRQGGP